MGSVSQKFQARKNSHVLKVPPSGKPLRSVGMAKMATPDNHVIIFGDALSDAMSSKFFVDDQDEEFFNQTLHKMEKNEQKVY